MGVDIRSVLHPWRTTVTVDETTLWFDCAGCGSREGISRDKDAFPLALAAYESEHLVCPGESLPVPQVLRLQLVPQPDLN